jgi:hypothetical protein
MSPIAKFLCLGKGDQWLLLKAWVLVGAVRQSLWVLPFSGTSRLRQWLCRPVSRAEPNPVGAEKLAWAVAVASRFVPGARHCLTQAIAAHTLLVRRGYPAEIHFGVRRQKSADLIAHAWVECDGKVLVGDTGLANCVRLMAPTAAPDGLPPDSAVRMSDSH